jgi:hypothetical protein
MIELAGSCSDGGTSCSWQGESAIVESGISSDSGLAAVHWGNSSYSYTNEIRTFHEDTNGRMSGAVYSGNKWTVGDAFLDVLPSTSIAATIDALAVPFIIRLWYRGAKGDLQESHWDSRSGGWTNRKSSRLPGLD